MTDRNSWCTGENVRSCLEIFATATTGSEWVYIDPCSNSWSKIKAYAIWTEETARTGGAPTKIGRRKKQDVEIVMPHPCWGLFDGYTGFVNWPFADPLPWAEAIALHCAKPWSPDGYEARWIVGLGICDPTTKWWATLESAASAICFPRERLAYEPPPGVQESTNDRPSALWLVQGLHVPSDLRSHDAWAFAQAFSTLGRVRPA